MSPTFAPSTSSELGLRGVLTITLGIPLVPYDEWVNKLEKSGEGLSADEEVKDMRRGPALEIIGTFTRCREVLIWTPRAGAGSFTTPNSPKTCHSSVWSTGRESSSRNPYFAFVSVRQCIVCVHNRLPTSALHLWQCRRLMMLIRFRVNARPTARQLGNGVLASVLTLIGCCGVLRVSSDPSRFHRARAAEAEEADTHRLMALRFQHSSRASPRLSSPVFRLVCLHSTDSFHVLSVDRSSWPS